MFLISFLEFTLSSFTLPLNSLSILITSVMTVLYLVDCLSPFCLVFFWSFVLFFHLGHISLSPHFGSLLIFDFCFYVLDIAAIYPRLCKVALSSMYSVGSSGIVITQAGHLRCVPSVGCVHLPHVVEPWLLLAHQWERFTPNLISYKDRQQPPTSYHHGWLAVQGPTPQSCSYFIGSLVPTESAPWVYWLWRWFFNVVGSCLLSTLAVGPPGRCRPRFSPACVLPGPPNMSCKAIYRRLLFVLGLKVPRQVQAVNQVC